MKKFELTVLSKINAAEAVVDSIDQLIKGFGGEILSFDNQGVKRLAYNIDQEDHAHYLFYEFKFDYANAEKLERELFNSNNVLRFLLIPTDKD